MTVLVAVIVAMVWDRRAVADFSVKEKDEASLSNCFRQDSLNAFILRFAGVWRFFIFEIFKLCAGLSTVTPFSEGFRGIH